MSKTITVRRADVAQIADLAFPEYRGPQHRVCVRDYMQITAANTCWQGGSKSTFVALRLSGGAWQAAPIQAGTPWSAQQWAGTIPDDQMIVEHRVSCGKDMGLVYHVSPTSSFLPRALPAPDASLTPDEAHVQARARHHGRLRARPRRGGRRPRARRQRRRRRRAGRPRRARVRVRGRRLVAQRPPPVDPHRAAGRGPREPEPSHRR